MKIEIDFPESFAAEVVSALLRDKQVLRDAMTKALSQGRFAESLTASFVETLGRVLSHIEQDPAIFDEVKAAIGVQVSRMKSEEFSREIMSVLNDHMDVLVNQRKQAIIAGKRIR